MDLAPTPADLRDRDWETRTDLDPLRVAVVGLGWFGRDEALPAIEDSDHCAPTVAVSGSAEKAARVADAHDLDAGVTYDQFHEGEAADAYDAAYVATPNARHLPFVESAADLGKHAICEKPMEATVDRAEAMVDACEDAGVRLMVAYRMQTEPMTRWARRLVEAGAVGDPVQVEGSFTGPLIRGDPDQWRFDPDLAGGGALYDIGVYPLNTARFVLDRDPVAVEATTVTDEKRLGGMDLHASFQLSFPGDVVASCRTSYDAAGETRFAVVGTEGRIELRDPFGVRADRHLVVEREGLTTEVGPGTVDELVEEFDYFAHAVRTGADIRPGGRDGLTDMRVLAGVYEAAETGRRVSLSS